MMNFIKLRWLFNKRVGLVLFYGLILCIVAGMVNIAGIKIAGDVQAWSIWLKARAPVFFVWRLLLYAGVGYGWWWMRQRVIKREEGDDQEGNTDVKARFIRIEIAAVCALVMLEVSQWLA